MHTPEHQDLFGAADRIANDVCPSTTRLNSIQVQEHMPGTAPGARKHDTKNVHDRFDQRLILSTV
jgi:hypothetical protein